MWANDRGLELCPRFLDVPPSSIATAAEDAVRCEGGAHAESHCSMRGFRPFGRDEHRSSTNGWEFQPSSPDEPASSTNGWEFQPSSPDEPASSTNGRRSRSPSTGRRARPRSAGTGARPYARPCARGTRRDARASAPRCPTSGRPDGRLLLFPAGCTGARSPREGRAVGSCCTPRASTWRPGPLRPPRGHRGRPVAGAPR
jgi:hypothetical protein